MVQGRICQNNQRDGYTFYSMSHGTDRPEDKESLRWFHEQWSIYPKRAHPDRTTNGSFHYGAVIAYRKFNEGRDPPAMSESFRTHVRIMDRFEKEEAECLGS